MPKVRIAPQKLIFTVFFIAFVVYSVVTLVSQAAQLREGSEVKKNQAIQRDYEQRRDVELDEKTSKIGTDEFIEQQAKEKLGYVKSNEKIFYDKAQ